MTVTYHKPKQGVFFGLCASVVLLLATPSDSFGKNSRDMLLVKLALGLSSTVAGATLLWQHRPTRIDDKLVELQARENQIEVAKLENQQQTQLMLEEANKQVEITVQKTIDMANERILEVNEEYQAQLRAQEEELLYLRQELHRANCPKLPPPSNSMNVTCRSIQQLLHQMEVIMDYDNHNPCTVVYFPNGKVGEQYCLEPRNLHHRREFEKIKGELPKLIEGELDETGSIKISQHGSRYFFTYIMGDKTTKQRLEEQEIKLDKMTQMMPTLEDIADTRLGIFLPGNSGSGKTTTSLALAEAIKNRKLNPSDYKVFDDPHRLEAIAIDVHANNEENAGGWDRLGVKAVWQPMAIIEQLEILKMEYEARKSGKKGNRILLFIDEFSETYEALVEHYLEYGDEEGKNMTETNARKAAMRHARFVKSLVTGASRKFGITPIVMNQTWNCKELKIDNNQRNNMVVLALNVCADTYYENQFKKGEFPEVKEALMANNRNYRALVTGGIPTAYIHHPVFPELPLTHTGHAPKHQPVVEFDEPTFRVVAYGYREPRAKVAALAPQTEAEEVQLNLEKLPNLDADVDQDTFMLTKIHEAKAQGHKTLKAIIGYVWGDANGNSRQYREWREEYRRLTGE